MANALTARAAAHGHRLRKPALLVTGFAALMLAAEAQAASDASPETASSDSGPAPSKEQCVAWHKQAQLAESQMKLVEARDDAQHCAAPTCPGLIISDCAQWLKDFDQRLPSVVFEVKVDGDPDTTATVSADGKPVGEWTRGEALRLDPGEHQFRIELGEYAPVVRKVLLAEGMRFRVISVEFKSSSLHKTAAAPSTPKAPLQVDETSGKRQLSPLFYPLVGVGAAGVVSFGVFSLVGKSKQHELENTCKPNCEQSALSSMKTSYLIGDISLGLGLASLATAGVLYFGAGSKPVPSSIGFVRLPGGGAAAATYTF